jgi:hypothetical protein
VLELLEDENGACLPHDEAVASRVERSRRTLGVVVPLRERPHRREAGDAHLVDGPRYPAEHDVRTAEADRVEAVAIAMFEAAHAVHCAESGPRVPSMIDTQPAPRFGMIEGIANGLTRSGPG